MILIYLNETGNLTTIEEGKIDVEQSAIEFLKKFPVNLLNHFYYIFEND